MGDHPAHLVIVVFLRAKILADPVFQRLRLADVDDLAAFIMH